MACSTTLDNGVVLLRFEGPLVASEVAAARTQLAAALSSSDEVIVSLAKATELDTAGVQLLYCAARSATAAGKHMAVTGVPSELSMCVERVGLSFDGIVDRWEGKPDA